jgi:hypothetical protein
MFSELYKILTALFPAILSKETAGYCILLFQEGQIRIREAEKWRSETGTNN